MRLMVWENTVEAEKEGGQRRTKKERREKEGKRQARNMWGETERRYRETERERARARQRQRDQTILL